MAPTDTILTLWSDDVLLFWKCKPDAHICSLPVPSSLWALAAGGASSLVSLAVSPLPSRSWISYVLQKRKQVFWTTILMVLLMLFCRLLSAVSCLTYLYLKAQSTQTRQIAALRSFSYAYNKTVDCFYFAPWLKWSIPIRAGTTMCDSLQENQSNVTESWENMFTFSF